MPNYFLSKQYINAYQDLKDESEKDSSFSAIEHFQTFGKNEGRHLDKDLEGIIDTALVTSSGFVVIAGWLLDSYRRVGPLSRPTYLISLKTSFYQIAIEHEKFIRFRRDDVSELYGLDSSFEFGFLCFCRLPEGVPPSNELSIVLHSETNYPYLNITTRPKFATETQLLSQYFKSLRHLQEGELGISSCLQAYDKHGKDVIACWQNHVRTARSHQVIRFGNKKRKEEFSVITVLYGSTDLLQLQYCLFFNRISQLNGRIIVVCNSPLMHTKVLDISHYAHMLYNMNITVVLMSDNVGFSEANNIGVGYSESEQIALVNPDIFSFHLTNWEEFFETITCIREKEIISPLLHYSDESVMHCGMTIQKEPILNSTSGKTYLQNKFLLRVDHPYKGQLFGPFEGRKRISVDAVTGGFMLFKRSFFENLNGLSGNYVFGHYEDADLCLRAKKIGGEIFCEPKLNFVHLEGKGSTSEDVLSASGSAIFNRCHFTRSFQEKTDARGVER
jgi:GT2 family glycosyltransferase